jgi:hypothetical protein
LATLFPLDALFHAGLDLFGLCYVERQYEQDHIMWRLSATQAYQATFCGFSGSISEVSRPANTEVALAPASAPPSRIAEATQQCRTKVALTRRLSVD